MVFGKGGGCFLLAGFGSVADLSIFVNCKDLNGKALPRKEQKKGASVKKGKYRLHEYVKLLHNEHIVVKNHCFCKKYHSKLGEIL